MFRTKIKYAIKILSLCETHPGGQIVGNDAVTQGRKGALGTREPIRKFEDLLPVLVRGNLGERGRGFETLLPKHSENSKKTAPPGEKGGTGDYGPHLLPRTNPADPVTISPGVQGPPHHLGRRGSWGAELPKDSAEAKSPRSDSTRSRFPAQPPCRGARRAEAQRSPQRIRSADSRLDRGEAGPTTAGSSRFQPVQAAPAPGLRTRPHTHHF